MVLNFVLIHAAPGDAIVYLIGNVPADPELVAQLRHRLGLDLPLHEQLTRYMAGVLRGDLGTSFYYQRPVLDVVLERLPATALLMGGQLLVTTAVGIPLGVLAARRRNEVPDNVISSIAILGFAVPAFWLAQIAILVFAVELGLFPAQGMIDARNAHEGIRYLLDVAWHLVLPVATLTFGHMALLIRITRTSVIDTLTRDFVVVARAKGLSERVITWRHVVRNSLMPVVTILGLEVGQIVAGMIVVETVFAWPGIGRLTYDSITRRDVPVIMGVFLLSAVAVVVANLLTDIAYGVLNPRVRVSARSG
jgi:peptide/nickel transport system permease protein